MGKMEKHLLEMIEDLESIPGLSAHGHGQLFALRALHERSNTPFVEPKTIWMERIVRLEDQLAAERGNNERLEERVLGLELQNETLVLKLKGRPAVDDPEKQYEEMKRKNRKRGYGMATKQDVLDLIKEQTLRRSVVAMDTKVGS